MSNIKYRYLIDHSLLSIVDCVSLVAVLSFVVEWFSD